MSPSPSSVWSRVMLLAFLKACGCDPTLRSERPVISEDRARQLALAKYDDFLADGGAVQTGDGTHVPFAKATQALQLTAERRQDSWLVSHKPDVGYAFAIRVALDGSWSAVEHADLLNE